MCVVCKIGRTDLEWKSRYSAVESARNARLKWSDVSEGQSANLLPASRGLT